MEQINQWDIWYAQFPFEDSDISKDRPVIVLSVEPLEVLSVKVTGSEPRDKYDIKLTKWKEAGLPKESTARISIFQLLSKDKFRRKIGELHIEDRNAVLGKFVEYVNEDS